MLTLGGFMVKMGAIDAKVTGPNQVTLRFSDGTTKVINVTLKFINGKTLVVPKVVG